jgi:hypothetical protein
LPEHDSNVGAANIEVNYNTVKYPIRAYFLCMYGKSVNYHSIFNLQNKRIDMRNVWGQSVGDLIILYIIFI